jgi:hypothetical protein
MDQRWALLRPGARARLAGLWLARVSIAVSLVLVGARSMDIPVGLPGAGDQRGGRPLTGGPARPPDVGQDPSLMPPLQLPPRLLPPPPAAIAGARWRPALVGVPVPVPVSEALSSEPARQSSGKLLAATSRRRPATLDASRVFAQARPAAPAPTPPPPPAASPPVVSPTPVPPPTRALPVSAPRPVPSQLHRALRGSTGHHRLVSPPQYRSEALTMLSSSRCPTSRGQPLSSRSCFRVPSTNAPTSASS